MTNSIQQMKNMKRCIFFLMFSLLANTVSAAENASVGLHGKKTDAYIIG